jgi:hypothetical protein
VVRRRLVVAGLGSIWHGFSLSTPADFPTKRRASARLAAVDSQVPGGSGLVPLMIAAAIGGPAAAGRLSFFSNVPRHWSGWKEIETLCLSAGVAVHPLLSRAEPEVGRTSHVLLFDQAEDDARTQAPRQRFIMDVQSLAGAASATGGGELSVSKAVLPGGAERRRYDLGEGDLLFADKEVAASSLRDWPGPVIFETGATGIELTDPSIKGQPSIWTAGVGSFVRTLACLAGWREKAGRRTLLTYLGSQPEIEKVLRRSPVLDARYLVRLCGFGTKQWKGGFSAEDETAFGRELLRSWHDLAPTIASLLGLVNPKNETWLKLSDWGVGRGVLVTAHEAGLMALWERGGRLQSISVEIEAGGSGDVLSFHTVSAGGAAGRRRLPRVKIRVQGKKIALAIGGSGRIVRLSSGRRRRNTLGAGDTVRGALAFGLWRLADTATLSDDPEGELAQIVRASAVLASVKCFVGSFIDFLRCVTELRGDSDAWRMLWPSSVSAEEERGGGNRS